MLIPNKLSTEYLSSPIGLDVAQPRLSWQVSAAQRNARQTAYQIVVRKHPWVEEAVANDLLWDTGKVLSDASLHIVYRGLPLAAGLRYAWRVRVWDEHDVVSEWSEAAFWEMGLQNPANWHAEWITPAWVEDASQPQPVPLLRRPFQAASDVVSARIYATSVGLYELWLNGQRVGEGVLTPGWTTYEHRLQYQTYDVTTLIDAGENVLGAMLGDGWYRGYMGHRGHHNVYGDRLALLVQLQLTYADGRVETIASDESWLATTGPITMSDLYMGEYYDARLEKAGWDAAGFDDSDWCGVQVIDLPKTTIVGQVAPFMKKMEKIRPISILHSPKGETILDFGQNMVGWVRVRVRGDAGTTISLRHAEILDQAGNLYTENLRTATQLTRYTLKGSADVDEVYEPRFSFQGFRYVAVEGFPTEPTLDDFTAVVVYSDMPTTGSFDCSNPLINQLQRNIVWGQKGNFVDVPTDCPQRDERLGWTGDTQVFIRTACFNMDVAAFLTKWLRDLSADQQPDGRVPFVVPDVLSKINLPGVISGGAAGWSDAAVICPWTIYLCYGDKRLLAEQYESMVGWVEFMRQRAGADFVWDNDRQFGDWLDYRGEDARRPMPVTNTELVATAFFAYSSQLLASVACTLGKSADAKKYTDLADNVKAAFNREFVTPSGRVGSNTQTGYVLALQFELLPEEIRPNAVARLVDAVREGGYHVTTGFLGTPYLCHVLSSYGHTDVAYQLLNQENYPSWLYPVKQGATTIWERWDGIKPDGSFQDASMNSFNHYAYGAIGDWLYRVVAGIEIDPAAPAYKRILIQPQLDASLTYANASLDSMYGRIESKWKIEAGRYHLTVTIPANTEGVVRIETDSAEKITEQGQPLSEVEGIRAIRQDGDAVYITIGSGRYEFVTLQ